MVVSRVNFEECTFREREDPFYKSEIPLSVARLGPERYVVRDPGTSVVTRSLVFQTTRDSTLEGCKETGD